MATPITISIQHQLGRAEARRRTEAGFANIIHELPGSGGACSERWDGDRLIFGVTAMGQTIDGVQRRGSTLIAARDSWLRARISTGSCPSTPIYFRSSRRKPPSTGIIVPVT